MAVSRGGGTIREGCQLEALINQAQTAPINPIDCSNERRDMWSLCLAALSPPHVSFSFPPLPPPRLRRTRPPLLCLPRLPLLALLPNKPFTALPSWKVPRTIAKPTATKPRYPAGKGSLFMIG